MSRLIVISNRVSAPKGQSGAQGGLAVAFQAALREYRGIWFGWSGELTDEFTGQINFQRSEGVTTATVDLEGETFHIDDQVEKLAKIQHDFWSRVKVEAYTSEHVFRLSSLDDALSVGEIKRRYGLENFRDYHRRAEGVQDRCRPVEATGMRHAG